MTHRLARFASGALVAAVLVVGRPAAQEPASPPSNQATFKSGVDSVSVDVIVTDKQGRAVTDLTPADFEIRESGKVQAVETFKLIKTDDGRDDPSAAREILSMDDMQQEVAREDNRLLIILLDDYHVRLGNSVSARQQVAAFVSQLTPHDLVAVATPLMPPSALTFSRNHDATASEIMNFIGRKYDYRPKYPVEERYSYETPAVQERLRNSWTISQLKSLCEYMGTLRDGRKTILYVSEGMTATLPAGVMSQGPNIPARRPAGAPDPTGQQASQNFFESSSLLSDMELVFSAATRTNTSIYTLDPRGLTTSEFNMADNVTATADRQTLGEATDNLRVLAEQTDGRAIINRNEPIGALKQMMSDGSTYYLLGYNSSLAPRDGKFHQIQVRVKRANVEVRARKGYWALSPEDVERANAPAKAGPAAEVLDALDELATSTDTGHARAVSVWMGATRGPAEKAHVTLTWEVVPVDQQLPTDRVDHVVVTATSIYGDALFNGRVDPDASTTPRAGHVTFDAPAGSVRVRVQAENATGRRLEATDATLEVPDFTITAAQITTPFVYRGRTARDIQQIRAAASPLPVTSRTFSRAERLLLRFQAFGPAGTTPALTMRLLNQAGASIAAMPAPTKTGDNDFESEFSLGAFPPGDYLIEVSATSGADVVKKLVAIRVTG